MSPRRLRADRPPVPPPAHLLAGCAHCGAALGRAWSRWAVRHYRRVDEYPEWVPADDRDCCSLACLQRAIAELAAGRRED